MRRNRSFGLSALLLAAGLILAACSPAATPTPTAKPASQATATPAGTAKPASPATAPAGTPAAKPATSAVSEADRVAALVEGAKKEGKVVVWSTMDTKTFESFTKGFQAKYPFIEVEFWRAGGGDDISEKVMAEARAGKYSVDVMGTVGAADYEAYKKANLLMKYDYPSSKDLPADWRDPEGLTMVHQINLSTMAYNTKLVSPAEAPKKWEDILDPKWKGNIAIDDGGTEFLGMLWNAWGKEKAVDYLRKLKQNDVLLKKGHTAITEMLAAGEFKVVPELFLFRVIDYQKKGAPIEWVRTDPMIGRVSTAGMLAKAPHPNAAKLYVDWWGSQEGQDAYDSVAPNFSAKGKKLGEATKGLNLKLIGAEVREDALEAEQIYRDILWPK